ncbi:MAG: hypothetical protein CVV47_03935 [Spirochaetae bacterium HGW-Spirochaetae-3]|jgi:hypothetical protein|nr:MAG: hypothetical protein CVV47_03935 [Spirochaetae bacterium HGW-Spirochaetae-3]
MTRPLGIALRSLAVLALATLVNFAPMATLGMPGMKEYSFHGIRVLAKTADQDDAEHLAARVEKQAGGIAEALGTADTGGIGIIVYPSRKDLHRKTIGFAGAFLPDWFIGDNTREWVLITSPANPGPAHDRESVERAAVHEYVHVLTDRVNKSLGYWLKEGLALYLAGQEPTVDAVRSYAGIRWDDYSRPSALQFAEVGGYTLAYTLVEYIADRYGWEAVVRLVPSGASMERVLGVGPRGLFDEWKAWLSEL